MSMNNSENIMKLSNKHVANINRVLEDIKSDIIADFNYANNRGLTITTNKVAFTLDLNTIKKYIKNVDIIDLNDVRNAKVISVKIIPKNFRYSISY